MQAYGYEKQESYNQQSKPRYLHDDDHVLTSQDMTIMSGKGLNITGIQTKRTQKGTHQSNKGTEVEDMRLDTQEEEFDLDAIDMAHKKQADDEAKKQAFGMSHNIFDVSSYGEVRLNNFQQKSFPEK